MPSFSTFIIIHSLIFRLGFQLEHRAPLGVSVITHAIRHTVGLLWTSDQPVAETSPAQDNTTYKHERQTSMPRAEFEPTIPATKQPQTYALDRAATGIGFLSFEHTIYCSPVCERLAGRQIFLDVSFSIWYLYKSSRGKPAISADSLCCSTNLDYI
jgi:hypothetical protein